MIYAMNVKSRERIESNSLKEKNERLKKDIKSALYDSFNVNEVLGEEIDELFTLVQIIDNILSSNVSLTKAQVADYCKSQRYFMRLYMKKLTEKMDVNNS